MNYKSSRGKVSGVSSAEAIKKGIAADGGLFVPESIPTLNEDLFGALEELNYQQRASRILAYYLTDFTEQEIHHCVQGAYNSDNFDNTRIAPLARLGENVYIQELWHGPTCAFKDMALQILPYLMTTSMEKTGETSEVVILVATSGDTGKAALEGFSDVQGTRIIVFFPAEGVSEVQKRQMVTQEGNNVYVAGVQGNFDDAQSGVKNIFASQDYNERLAEQNMKMSSANSINWGRLLPQIVYYISAYIDLRTEGAVKTGDKINIVVPTGNFGNILAAYYAGKMGVPIGKLICAANSNNVLTDFIRSGIYDRNRPFEKTISPSMDILISSNLERLLFEITGHDAQKVSNWMEELQSSGCYNVGDDVYQDVARLFWSDYCSDQETIATINRSWKEKRYLLDTHTAVAVNVYEKYQQATGDNTISLVASTASPFKFGSSVAAAVLPPEMVAGRSEFELLYLLEEYTGVQMPDAIKGLEHRPVLHKTVCKIEDMEKTVSQFLGLE
ncbi:threonine synthase [hydrocarbon metagenome]|uniref:Threonine synthase n=1 Tax=hydrocarbon metagenome TaxID=938273 RepID=A0A0W8E9L0_9ZZZZ